MVDPPREQLSAFELRTSDADSSIKVTLVSLEVRKAVGRLREMESQLHFSQHQRCTVQIWKLDRERRITFTLS